MSPARSAGTLPTLVTNRRRYALDVNINSLDVLNHKRLLDSARSDPSAVSFQLRPVDVVTGSDLAKRPSFGSLDTLQLHQEVRAGAAVPHCQWCPIAGRSNLVRYENSK